MKVPLEIRQLGDLIRDSLPDDSIKVIGEVSQPKIFRGNVYLNLKDNFYSIKSIIWKNKYDMFKIDIKDGDKIVVSGKLDYYGSNGSVSFIIDQLIKHDGEGELYQLYKKYKSDFENRGYFLEKNKFILPDKIEKILLMTSQNGAAIQDFIYALDNNQSKLDYDIIDIPVQGQDCPSILIKEINKIDKKYDAIVITRGGGSFEDLFGFSKPELIECINKFDQPIISAIGHQVDTSLLDLVADCNCPTPSLAAQYIIDKNKKYVNNLILKKEYFKEILLEEYNKQNKGINKCLDRLHRIVISFDRIQQSFHNELINQLNTYSFKLKELDLKLSSLLNEKNDGIIIKNQDDIQIINLNDFKKIINNNQDFVLEWNKTKIKFSDYEYIEI